MFVNNQYLTKMSTIFIKRNNKYNYFSRKNGFMFDSFMLLYVWILNWPNRQENRLMVKHVGVNKPVIQLPWHRQMDTELPCIFFKYPTLSFFSYYNDQITKSPNNQSSNRVPMDRIFHPLIFFCPSPFLKIGYPF